MKVGKEKFLRVWCAIAFYYFQIFIVTGVLGVVSRNGLTRIVSQFSLGTLSSETGEASVQLMISWKRNSIVNHPMQFLFPADHKPYRGFTCCRRTQFLLFCFNRPVAQVCLYLLVDKFSGQNMNICNNE